MSVLAFPIAFLFFTLASSPSPLSNEVSHLLRGRKGRALSQGRHKINVKDILAKATTIQCSEGVATALRNYP